MDHNEHNTSEESLIDQEPCNFNNVSTAFFIVSCICFAINIYLVMIQNPRYIWFAAVGMFTLLISLFEVHNSPPK